MAARDDGPPQGTGAADAGGAPAGAARRQRWLARLAFIGAAAVVTVVLLSGALRSIAVLLLGLAGLAVTCAAKLRSKNLSTAGLCSSSASTCVAPASTI